MNLRRLQCGINSVALVALTMSAATVAYGANECRVEYGYHTGSGFNRTDHKKTTYLNVGQTKTIGQSQLNYVKNLKSNKARFNLQGANNVTLDQNAVNPMVAFYLSPVTLSSVTCLNQTTVAFGSPEALISAFKQANNTAEQIAKALKDTFNLGAQQVSELMRAANYSAEQTAAALKSAFNASNQQIAQWLKAAGYSGQQVVAALKNGLNVSAQAAANIVRSVFSASVSQLAQWLKAAGYSLVQVAQALEAVESDPQKVAQALRASFNLSANQLVQTFKQIQKVITAQNCTTSACEQAGTLLKNIGYNLNDALKALKTHYNISAQAAYNIAKNVYGAGTTAIEQALAFAGYTAQQIAAVMNQGITLVARTVQTTTRNAAEQSFLGLYDAYFKVVATGARMSPLHLRYRNALNKAGINAASVKIGYSRYLDPSKVAMTDCDSIYFPTNDLVGRLTRGQAISTSELGWLLHELGHTVQCRSQSRRAFANRWFGELSPAVISSIESGRPDPKTIHDAMPLEQEADAHASRHLRTVSGSLGGR